MEEAIPPLRQKWSLCIPGASWLKSSLAGKDLEVLVDAKLTMGQECPCVAEMASGSLSCFSQHLKGHNPFPLLNPRDAHLGCAGLLSAWYWFSGASLALGSTCQEKHTRAAERNYWRLQPWSICQCGERLRAQKLLSLERRRVSGGIINVHKSLARVCEEDRASPFSWPFMKGQGATDTNWKTGNSI